MNGTVEAIRIASSPGGAMEPVDSIRAIAGEGLEGDRYRADEGTFSKKPDPKQQLTLIESEAIEAAQRDYDLAIDHADTRRNILTRGVGLNHLVDRDFSVGTARLRGLELCEPCGHMEKLCGKENARKSLIHRGGLRCEILETGEIVVGDSIREESH